MSDKAKLLASAQKSLQKNQLAKAIKDFRKVVQLDPKDIRSRQKLAELLSRDKQRDDALDEYEVVAKYYTENGFYLKAIAVYKQMQKLDPSQVKYYHRLAELNEKQGLLGNALSEYRNLVAYYEKNQMTSEAIDVLQKMKELEPENLNVLVKIAEVFAVTGMKDKARDEFDAVLESLTDKGDFTKVVKLCDMFKNFFPDDQTLLVLSADALINLGQAAKGIEQLCALPENIRKSAEALRSLANGYDQLGKFADAAATSKQSLALAPADLDLQQNYIEACFKADEYQEPLQNLEEWKDAFLEQDRIAVLKGYYETLQKQLPHNEQVLKTLQAIYELSGDGDKLFDLMSAEETTPELAEPSTLETLDDSLLQNAVDDLDEVVTNGLPDLTGESPEDFSPADAGADGPPEPVTDETGPLPDEPGSDSEESAEVSLDFLEDVALEEPAVAEETAAGLELELELDLDLDLDLSLDLDDSLPSDSGAEEAAPAAEIEEAAPAAEIEEAAPAAEAEGALSVNVAFELEEAEFYLQQGLFDDAAEVCRKILDFDPDNRLAQAKLTEIFAQGTLVTNTGEMARSELTAESEAPVLLDHEAAEDAFDWDDAGEQAVAEIEDDIDPEDAESHFNLGIAYKEMGLLDDAVNEFSTAMRHHLRRFDALILKGVCLAEKGEVEIAEQVLSEGLSLPGLNKSERVSLNFELGLLKEANGQLDVALEYFQQAAQVDHFFRDVGLKIKQLKKALGISDAGLDESLSPDKGKNKVSYL
ncbi:MAG TPA: tetratricopeptide repeat protein [Geothermobacteraceae bacterium]|nr:tetratricopeptide repeat protein [Geothermobacteraceae bacterium]